MKLIVLLLSILSTPAFAQQSLPDSATLQRVIVAIQQQRERAANEAVSYQIEAQKLAEERQRLAEENSKLKAEIEALKKPIDAK